MLSKTKVTCIGAGYWGKNLIRNFASLGSLYGICDQNSTTRASFQSQYPEARIFSELKEALESPEVDAITIATPAESHATLARMSLEHGKSVYIEKPLCLDEREGAELVALAKEKQLTLMVGHLLWYHPAVLKIKEMLDSGTLGSLRYIYSQRLNMGLLRNRENVLWSFAPHDISMILGMVGDVPESVAAHGGTFLTEGIPDSVVATMTFKNNVKGHIFVSWLHPTKEQKLVLVGDKGMLVFDDTLPWAQKLCYYSHTVKAGENCPIAVKADPEYITLTEQEPLKEECLHFLDCVEQKKIPRTDGAEGMRVLEVLNRIQSELDHK